MRAVSAAADALADAVELGSDLQERAHFMASALALLAHRGAVPGGEAGTLLRATVGALMIEADLREPVRRGLTSHTTTHSTSPGRSHPLWGNQSPQCPLAGC